MGRLQFRRGTQVPSQLAAGEPFFDGNDLHVGRIGGGGNKKIGGSSVVFNDTYNFPSGFYASKFFKNSSYIFCYGYIIESGNNCLVRIGLDGIFDSITEIPFGISEASVISTGKIYIVTSDNTIIRLNIDGTVDNSFIEFSLPDCYFSGIVEANSGYIYIGVIDSTNNYQCKIRRLINGVLDEEYTNVFQGSPAYKASNGRIFYTIRDGQTAMGVSYLDSDGLYNNPSALNVSGLTLDRPIELDGKLVFASDGILYYIDIETFQINQDPIGNVNSSFVLKDDIIYVINEDGQLWASNAYPSGVYDIVTSLNEFNDIIAFENGFLIADGPELNAFSPIGEILNKSSEVWFMKLTKVKITQILLRIRQLSAAIEAIEVIISPNP